MPHVFISPQVYPGGHYHEDLVAATEFSRWMVTKMALFRKITCLTPRFRGVEAMTTFYYLLLELRHYYSRVSLGAMQFSQIPMLGGI